MQAKLYTDQEIREALIVGVGLGGPADGDLPSQEQIEEALNIFGGGHGRVIPNYDTFKRLHEERDWRGLAEAHIAAAHMASTDAAPHALVALACLGREVVDELGHLGGLLDALDTGRRSG